MTAFADDNFDWTNGEEAGSNGGAAVADALDFVIPSFSATTDVEQVEQEAADNKFASPPPGTYLFEITGFLKPPEQVSKTLYVGPRAESCRPWKVAMKLRVVGQGNLSMLDNIELPPSSPKELATWQAGTKGPNGDRRFAGFMAKKLEHLIKRIGFPFVAGDPIPAEALALRAWVGRRVYANVVMGKPEKDPVTNKPKVDPATGLPFAPRPQIELFSYRESEETVTAQAGQPAPVGRPTPAAQPVRPAAPATGTAAQRFAEVGLNNV